MTTFISSLSSFQKILLDEEFGNQFFLEFLELLKGTTECLCYGKAEAVRTHHLYPVELCQLLCPV